MLFFFESRGNLQVGRRVPIKAAPIAYQEPPRHIQFHQNSIFAPRAPNPSGSPSVRWSSSTRRIRGPHLVKRFIYQIATYKCATMRDHAMHGSPVHTRRLDPRCPGGGARYPKKGCSQQAFILKSGLKTRIVARRIIFIFPQIIRKKRYVPPQQVNTHETVGGLQGGLG